MHVRLCLPVVLPGRDPSFKLACRRRVLFLFSVAVVCCLSASWLCSLIDCLRFPPHARGTNTLQAQRRLPRKRSRNNGCRVASRVTLGLVVLVVLVMLLSLLLSLLLRGLLMVTSDVACCTRLPQRFAVKKIGRGGATSCFCLLDCGPFIRIARGVVECNGTGTRVLQQHT